MATAPVERMDGQCESGGQQLQESSREEWGYSEKSMENLEGEHVSEESLDHESINEKVGCDKKSMIDAQDLKYSKDPKEIQVEQENKGFICENHEQKAKEKMQESQSTTHHESDEENHSDNEDINGKEISNEKPPGDAQELNCCNTAKEVEKNKGFICENHEQKAKEKMQEPQTTTHHESDEENHSDNEYPNEKLGRGETSMRNVQKSQINEDVNRHQCDQGKQSGLGFLWIGILLIPLFAYLWLNFQINQESEVKVLNIFLQNFEKVQRSFPNQEEQLWKRSKILLQKQVNKTVHSEPVILMFAAAWDAEETMRCLTSRIAGAYAMALSSRIFEIDGNGKRFLNSDEVKLDLDNQLSSGFREGRKSAIVHQFQELPPASTLMFYKYCDHENAAFKDVSLLITVLVDEPKLDPDLGLDALEEMVYNFLIMKFNVSSNSAQYNILDSDKFSGLWSRIAHAILPVRPEREIEEKGCGQAEMD
ncbi:torsin-1A-interacting protein 2-like isoform X1 [Leucoraja erinacea]|uniref:torsin-1A-interacting protein 2-like isoform X1 n=1 Tax=Leucoraja erinaceus TaxID=7782 RepID=UPI0024580A6A|nr:torsin-1A-interacting protein 2-like isoform X1 [Leucoraja erinacea]